MKMMLMILAAAFAGVLYLAPAGCAGMYDNQGITSPSGGAQSSVPELRDYVFGLRWSDGTCATKTIMAAKSHDEAMSSVKKLCSNCSISDVASSRHGSASSDLMAKSESFCPSRMY